MIKIKWELEQQSKYAREKYHRANGISTATQLSLCLDEICFKIESIQQDQVMLRAVGKSFKELIS